MQAIVAAGGVDTLVALAGRVSAEGEQEVWQMK